MILTKLANMAGDFEYVNLEQVATINVSIASGTSYFNVIFSGGMQTHIAIDDPVIAALKTAADV